jgi:hypothetical protein
MALRATVGDEDAVGAGAQFRRFFAGSSRQEGSDADPAPKGQSRTGDPGIVSLPSSSPLFLPLPEEHLVPRRTKPLVVGRNLNPEGQFFGLFTQKHAVFRASHRKSVVEFDGVRGMKRAPHGEVFLYPCRSQTAVTI